eukprot:CAMPEP_0172732568 /NCGR_PEP_ID=MMETSP1074-20121228/104768_1 /TAXON_ID=2916 /ORGANISM="Ceratium fusus, Strain PA161109" /LENGTH=122 /DNA_ID=CAMNT_0013560901 /DNA_START=793 /DNA_END=1161 /DNA_ORIENTATION=+
MCLVSKRLMHVHAASCPLWISITNVPENVSFPFGVPGVFVDIPNYLDSCLPAFHLVLGQQHSTKGAIAQLPKDAVAAVVQRNACAPAEVRNFVPVIPFGFCQLLCTIALCNCLWATTIIRRS